MHSYYLGPGVSEKAVREEATDRVRRGEPVSIHSHHLGAPCAGQCEWWQPPPEQVPAQRGGEVLREAARQLA